MGYKVFPYRDLSKEETLARLDKFCCDDNLKEVDVAVVCFLSHGMDEKTFKTWDSKNLTVTEVS